MTKTIEQYARAVQSSNLKMDEHHGDADRLVAAGWSNRLGTLLLRCRGEWDRERAALELADKRLRDENERARAAAAKKNGGAEALRISLSAESEALTSRLLILMQMSSLGQAAGALVRFATQRAEARGYVSLSAGDIERVVKSALDVWLDQRCNACAGRGLNGGYGAPVITCKRCRGGGRRRRMLPAKTADEHALGEWLIVQIEQTQAAAARQMARRQRRS